MATYIEEFYNRLINSPSFNIGQKKLIERLYKQTKQEYRKRQLDGMGKSEKVAGRPRKITDMEKFKTIFFAYRYGQISFRFVKELLNMSKSTIYRYGDLIKNTYVEKRYISSSKTKIYEEQAISIAKQWSHKLNYSYYREEFIQEACLSMWEGLGYWEEERISFIKWANEVCSNTLDEFFIKICNQPKTAKFIENYNYKKD